MQFLTKDDILKLIDIDTLDVLTDEDDTRLDTTEDTAIQEMTTYLNTRYDTTEIFTGTEKNSLIVMYLTDIILYHLHSRIAPDNIPELRVNRYTNARDWLEKAADGFTSPLLPAKAADKNIPLRSGNSSPKTDFYY